MEMKYKGQKERNHHSNGICTTSEKFTGVLLFTNKHTGTYQLKNQSNNIRFSNFYINHEFIIWYPFTD